MTEAPGYAVRTPDSLLRGPVSTALTSTIQSSKHPVGIVGILRLIFGVRRRCAFDVSTMDTSDPPRPARPLPSANRPPRLPVQASVSEVMTLTLRALTGEFVG